MRQCGVPKAPTSDSLRTRAYQDSATLPEPRPACDAMCVAAVVVIGARFTVRRAFGEEMIDRPKHRVGHGHHGFLVPAMPHYASVSGLQRTVLRASRRCGGFDEGHPQPPVAFP